MRPSIFYLPIGMSALSVSPVFADQSQGPIYGPNMWHSGWHGWFLGPIMMIVVIVLAAVAVALVFRWIGRPGHGDGAPVAPSKTPLDILKERFVMGEIDKEEFEERRRVLDE